MEVYRQAATTLAAQFMADEAARARVLPCSEPSDECALEVITEFGLRAFRRPLLLQEVADYQQLYDERATLTASGTFEEALQLIVEAFLQSPAFLLRTEISQDVDEEGYFILSHYEVASRLSYMLWQSMPDPELFDAAAAGVLQTQEQVLEQALRMVQDPKARTMVSAFHQFYARMGENTRWGAVDRDTEKFPLFSSELVPAMLEETRLVFDEITFSGGTFEDLLTSPVAFVNAALAPVYGLDPSAFGAEFVKVELDPAQRPGVFTRAGFLASYSYADRTAPILRGAFLLKEVLCTQIGDPTPEAVQTPLPTEPELVTNRQRVAAQTGGEASCLACHADYINPLGYALEAFDAVGAAQTLDNGAPVDTSAQLTFGSSVVDVAGPADLMNELAHSPQAQRCYAQKWVSYAYERVANPQDACLVEALASSMAAGDYPISQLLADLTRSDSFLRRVSNGSPGLDDDPPTPPVPPSSSAEPVVPVNPAPDASEGPATDDPTDTGEDTTNTVVPSDGMPSDDMPSAEPQEVTGVGDAGDNAAPDPSGAASDQDDTQAPLLDDAGGASKSNSAAERDAGPGQLGGNAISDDVPSGCTCHAVGATGPTQTVPQPLFALLALLGLGLVRRVRS
jgi:MYXO-CTERM domain-containing protein